MLALIIILIVATLSLPAQSLAQVDEEELCRDAVPIAIASQQQIDSLSTLLVYNRALGSFTYLWQQSDQVDFTIDVPRGLNGAYPFGEPQVSPDGTNLLGVYIDSDAMLSISILNLLDSRVLEIERVLHYSGHDTVPIYWANDDTIAVSMLNNGEPPFFSRLIDIHTGISLEVPLARGQEIGPIYLPHVSPDLTRVAYVDLFNREERLIVSNIRSQDLRTIFSTINFAPIRYFSWSLDSEHIAVITDRNSYGVLQDLTLVDMAGNINVEIPLTHAADYARSDANMQWSSDGQWIAYKTGDPVPVINVLNLSDFA
ncbi:MAG: hypothetical protein KC519_18650, partial [Anaerolineae bacterium]|nr:hypothetical protein [Anaerolineae bacterium]